MCGKESGKKRPQKTASVRNLISHQIQFIIKIRKCKYQLSEEKMKSEKLSEAVPAPIALRDPAGEEERIRRALAAAGGNKSQAARLLGIDRKTLYNKLHLYGIE